MDTLLERIASLDFHAWILVLILMSFFILAGNYLFRSSAELVHKRIERMELFIEGTDEERRKHATFARRLQLMAEERISRMLRQHMKQGRLRPLRTKLIQANIDMDPIHHWTQKVMYAIGMSVLGLFMAKVSYIVMFALLGFFLPDLRVAEKLKKRQLALKKDLPDFLDLLSSTAPSAQNLEDAIRQVCKRTDGPMSKEFRIALDQVNASKRTRDALNDLAFRCGLLEIDQLVGAINKSEAFGTGIEKTLAVQAESMRKLTKQLAEIKARKISILLILPCMFLLITILVVIAGPSVVALLDAQSAFSGAM